MKRGKTPAIMTVFKPRSADGVVEFGDGLFWVNVGIAATALVDRGSRGRPLRSRC
jgi:hypothetical protein